MQHLQRFARDSARVLAAHMNFSQSLPSATQSSSCVRSSVANTSFLYNRAANLFCVSYVPYTARQSRYSTVLGSISASAATPRAPPMTNPSPAAQQFLDALKSDEAVVVRDSDAVFSKLQRLWNGGLSNLHVVTDFDCTLTRYWVNGQRSATSHAVVSNSHLLPTEAKNKIESLYNEYYPIEVCHVMTSEKKTPLMEEWWHKVHNVLVSANLCRHDIEVMVRNCPVSWRDQLQPVLSLCSQQDVPVLVFSAGLADVILEILSQAGLLTPNVHVISNKMIFSDDEQQRVIGFADPVIHVYNKSEGALSAGNASYFQDLAHRRNVLLLGDSLGDLRMADGMEHDTCLTVGFLNHDVDKLEARYTEAFDVVLLNDAPMTWVQRLLEAMQGIGRQTG